MRQQSETAAASASLEAFRFVLLEYVRRVSSLNPIDSLYWLPTAANKKYAESKQLLRSKIEAMVVDRYEARARGQENHQDFLENILDAIEVESSAASKRNARDIVVDNIFTILSAGFDTSSLLLTFSLLMLARHPEARTKLEEEADRVLQDEPVQFKHQAQLKYTTMFLREVLRVHPSVPSTTRTLVRDTQLGGTTVPAGTEVWIGIYLAHRSKYAIPFLLLASSTSR